MDKRRIMLKKRLMLLSVPFFVFLFSARAFAQQGVKFIYPLDVPMSLSGNYGELRGNHFHGGIDFRVGGVVGAPIKATADGYVSKITVSPSGYGNALYITHSN
jgi:murein DD-endopeptidase MepM/ murein hydrolase activator NlpD